MLAGDRDALPRLEPKAIVSKLLGSDIDTDDHEDDESVGVTGKQGGRLLACYLFSVKDDAALTFLAQGIKAWLEAQLPKYAVVHPVQTSCLKNAVKFLPELERGLAAAAAAHVTLATTRSSRRHAAHVRHRLRRPHRPRLTSEPARTGMAGDGWGWLGMGGDGWGWAGGPGGSLGMDPDRAWQNIDAIEVKISQFENWQSQRRGMRVRR